eukprot:scaffold7341_cov129-Isochrysis_galbana.AAC.6
MATPLEGSTLVAGEWIKKKLVRLKKPRLPSALGLSGACGVVAYTLASLSTLTPLSPLTPYRPPPSYSCTDYSYKPEGGGGWTVCTNSVLTIGWVERGRRKEESVAGEWISVHPCLSAKVPTLPRVLHLHRSGVLGGVRCRFWLVWLAPRRRQGSPSSR